MAATPAEAPLVVKTLVEVSTLLPSRSAFCGRRSVHLSSERFATITEEGDLWSPSSVTHLDLLDPKNVKVNTVRYRKHNGGERLFVATRSPGTGMCLLHALSNRVWIAHADKADAGIVISAGHVVQYAVWLNDYCTALVKEREIVHINTNGMDLCHLPLPPAFKEYCVVDYQQSSLSKNKHEEWSLASAIKVEVTGQCKGLMIAYELNTSASSLIAGFSGTFIPTCNPHNASRVRVITADIGQSGGSSLLVRVIELKSGHATGQVSCHTVSELTVVHPRDHDVDETDVPCALKIDAKHNMAFILTKLGYAHMVGYDCNVYIGSLRISTTQIMAVATRVDGGLLIADRDGVVRGVLVMSETGTIRVTNLQISTVRVNARSLLPVFREKAGPGVAFDFAVQSGEPIDTELFMIFFRETAANAKARDRLRKMVIKYMDILPSEATVEVLSGCLYHYVFDFHEMLRLATSAQKRFGIETVMTAFDGDKSGAALFKFLSYAGISKLTGLVLKRYIAVAAKLEKFEALIHFTQQPCSEDPNVTKEWLLETDFPPQIRFSILESFYGRHGLTLDLARMYREHKSYKKVRELISKLHDRKSQLLVVIQYVLGSGMSTKDLIQSVSMPDLSSCREFVIQECIKENLTEFLMAFLEFVIGKGDVSESVHTELLVMYVLSDSYEKAYSFVRDNKYYDALKAGQRLEKDRVNVALLVYENRKCDFEFIRVTNEKKMYPRQVAYLLKRKDGDLWDTMLLPSNEHRLSLLEALEHHKLSSFEYSETAIFIQSVARTDLRSRCFELIDQLLVMEFTPEQTIFFQGVGIRVLLEIENVEHAVEQCIALRNYDHQTVALALMERGYYEDAIETLVKGKCLEEAAQSLKLHMVNCNDIIPLNRLGDLFLEHGSVGESLRYYNRAKNYTNRRQIYRMAVADDKFNDWDALLEYFVGVKRIVKDPTVHSNLAFILAKANRLEELEKHVFDALEETAQDTKACRICEDAIMDITLAPCGHVCACSTCAERLSECPICRAVIDSRIRIFTT